MNIYMDMGTSNTRLWLCDGERVLSSEKGAFGAGTTLSHGKQILHSNLRELLLKLLADAKIKENEVSYILASGMASSELGILEVPHLPAPAGLCDLVKGIQRTCIEQVTGIPFLIVPGVKITDADGNIADMMRGEETETFGIADLFGIKGKALLVLPGSHNKAILLEDGKIADFATALSGELLSCIAADTILKANVSFDFTLDNSALLEGSRYATAKGLGAALFHVRVMGKNGASADTCSSFFFGAVLSEDVTTIRSLDADAPVYVGGRQNLRAALAALLGDCTEIPDNVSSNATLHGLMTIDARNTEGTSR
jgi:2-dehydro-3-deoxygalactonokinase